MKVRAPGRVNLIGEHTDYNEGFVLPIALQLETRIESEPSPDGKLHVRSVARNETRTFENPSSATRQNDWTDYVIGVARQLPWRPLSMKIGSTVPEGAGLSSSAALEVATALTFAESMDRLEMAKLCQRAEIEFVGMPCGIMDQYVSIFGQRHAALKIDCRSLESESVPLPDGVSIIAVNSMVKHQLGDSAYRTRVAECAEACREAGVASLRDATLEQVAHSKRGRYVVMENQRVLDFVEASRRNDLETMGRLFLESHAGMRDDYEISCPEIDFLVETASKIHGCYGARMTGGGFGGCTVNLVESGSVRQFSESIRNAYPRAQVIECTPSDGASIL